MGESIKSRTNSLEWCDAGSMKRFPSVGKNPHFRLRRKKGREGKVKRGERGEKKMRYYEENGRRRRRYHGVGDAERGKGKRKSVSASRCLTHLEVPVMLKISQKTHRS